MSLMRIGVLVGLFMIPVFASGCAQKCTPGSSAYPDCLPEQGIAFDADLTIWNLTDPSEALLGQIQQFESDNPGLSVEYRTFQDRGEYERLLLNEMAAGGGPDIFAIENDWLPRHQNKISPLPQNLFSLDSFIDAFYDVAQDLLIRQGEAGNAEIYGLPLAIDTLALYYNRDIFRDGLPSASRPADTWGGVLEQVVALTQQSNDVERFALTGIAMGRGDNISLAADIYSFLLLQYGGEVYDVQGRESIFTEGANSFFGGQSRNPARDALFNYTSYGLPSFRNYSWNALLGSAYPNQEEVGAFAQGKVAMIFGYSDQYENIRAAIQGIERRRDPVISESDIGIVEAPQLGEAEEEALDQVALARVHALTVSKNSQSPEASWALLLFLTGQESMRAYHEQTRKPTARFDLYEEQVVESPWGVFVRQVPYSRIVTTLDSSLYQEIIQSSIQSVIVGSESIQAAISQADEQFECLWGQIMEGEGGDEACL